MKRDINIVVVDDSNMVRTVMYRALDKDGYFVMFDAINGLDLIDKLSNVAILPDVCLLDVQMPMMDGFETAKELKKRWPSIRILAHTSNNDQETLIRMLQNGADGYIIKGCPPAEVATAVRKLYEDGYYFNDWACLNMLSFIRNPAVC